MSRSADTDTRTIPVAVLKINAGILLILWLTIVTALMLLSWSFDGPLSAKIARGAMLAAMLTLSAWIGQAWRTAVGMTPAASANDARYFLATVVLLIPTMTLMYLDYTQWPAWRITAISVLAVGILALFVLHLRDRRGHKNEIVAPIAAMTIRTHLGDREVRIAQPEGMHDRWATRWSIATAQGTIQRVSYGPNPIHSLTAALTDAEATIALI